ncbi:MAG: glycine--tRNA ligase subunit beta [Firmicutes bacterium]|nr:glycine--tRNA ligase subunit beta [Bacillota bacterium]
MAKSLLLEIGTEEIPARFMRPVLVQLQDLVEKTLADARLDYKNIETYGTPRRIALLVEDLAPHQREGLQEVKGPSRKAAYDAQGKPTKAAEGFARSQGLSVDALEMRTTPSGEYLYAVKRETGRPTDEIIGGFLVSWITGLSFPKPMRWAYNEMRFARPIRWLVALYGDEVVDIDLEGLKSGRLTYGHRFLSQGPISLKSPVEYLDVLEKHYVIADHQRRQEMVWAQVTDLAAREGGQVEMDENLLEEVTFLLEYPTALCGRIEDQFMVLPDRVIMTPMREHQRYFPVLDSAGKLLPKFITVRNGTAEHLDIVRVGNEKVLRPRLSDARFFLEEDLKQPLVDLVPKLEKIVFLEDLGMMSDKVRRIREITGRLADYLGWDEGERRDADRAALLCKADLVTKMVYEFPELQGYMGMEYAGRNGEKPVVAQAIKEHYQPRFSGDELPESRPGVVVSIADKMDSLVGCIAAGIKPTGSQDPYALRRQALGICHLLLENGIELALDELIGLVYDRYLELPEVKLKLKREAVIAEVMDFIQQRLRNLLLERGITYDVADAALAAGCQVVPDLFRRAEAISRFRERGEFDDLITAYTRANNLSKFSESDTVDPAVFVEAVEKKLLTVLQQVEAEMPRLLAEKKVEDAMLCLAQLREPVGEFFDGVMVMVEDAAVKANRLAMLKRIARLGQLIADFSRIVLAEK